MLTCFLQLHFANNSYLNNLLSILIQKSFRFSYLIYKNLLILFFPINLRVNKNVLPWLKDYVTPPALKLPFLRLVLAVYNNKNSFNANFLSDLVKYLSLEMQLSQPLKQLVTTPSSAFNFFIVNSNLNIADFPRSLSYMTYDFIRKVLIEKINSLPDA